MSLSDPHFCELSRDCFNLSREYFSLWAIKTSLDRNASALLDLQAVTNHMSSNGGQFLSSDFKKVSSPSCDFGEILTF